MLPPVDPRVLERNPSFDVLYKDLTSRKMNPDGSSRDTKKQRMHDEIRRSLTIARTNLTSTQILIQSLTDLPSRSSNLPFELHPTIELVTAQLNGHIPSSDREILSDDISTFVTNLPTISSALSAQLVILVTYLAKIADPKSPPAISNLANISTSLQHSATLTLPSDLATARIHLANTTSAYLATHLSLLTSSIRVLEQTQHGALSRHTKSSAELLHACATVLGLQAKIHALSHPPPPEFMAALKAYKKAQGAGDKALRDREGVARRALELYDAAGAKGMRDLAKRKGWLEREVEAVEGEAGVLEGK